MAKPSVGIVFSCEGAFSKHSEYFSIYFGTCLSKEGLDSNRRFYALILLHPFMCDIRIFKN